jgi:hypothetical protein
MFLGLTRRKNILDQKLAVSPTTPAALSIIQEFSYVQVVNTKTRRKRTLCVDGLSLASTDVPEVNDSQASGWRFKSRSMNETTPCFIPFCHDQFLFTEMSLLATIYIVFGSKLCASGAYATRIIMIVVITLAKSEGMQFNVIYL